jgi:hypothetical protein
MSSGLCRRLVTRSGRAFSMSSQVTRIPNGNVHSVRAERGAIKSIKKKLEPQLPTGVEIARTLS